MQNVRPEQRAQPCDETLFNGCVCVRTRENMRRCSVDRYVPFGGECGRAQHSQTGRRIKRELAGTRGFVLESQA